MTKIKPFSAITYNPDKIKDLSQVVCPPYDIINKEAQDSYYKCSPYNMVRLILSKDTPEEDRYKSAAHCLKDWLGEGILVKDEKPAIYFYNQVYSLKGEKKSRLGFIALLRLGEDNTVFAHESTRVEPKEDRFKLLKAVKTNLSPIFVLFSDIKRIIRRTQDQHLKNKKPFIDIVDKEGVQNQVWRVTDSDILDKIITQMQDRQIFIADGHHRYEVALAYRERMKKLGYLDPEADFNYIMAYFTNIESKGLVILPIHRIIKGIAGFPLSNFRLELNKYFDIEEIKDKVRFSFLMQKAGERQHTLGMYKDNIFFLLRLKNLKLIDRIIEPSLPFECRSLDISILNFLILKKILGLDIEDNQHIQFSHNAEELIKEADNDRNSIVFLLNPIRIEQLVSVAKLKERLPSKSTYFYPKVLSGLVINKFKEEKR